MTDTSLPEQVLLFLMFLLLWCSHVVEVTDEAEYGNPDNLEDFKFLSSWDPYRNAKETEYPSILALASLPDDRVPYWHAAKYIAKYIFFFLF
jgi:protease II